MNKKISQLIDQIRQKQFKHSFNKNEKELTRQEAVNKLQQTQVCHDELLKQSLALVDMVDQYVTQNSQQYDVLASELEREKVIRGEDRREFQENNLLVDSKLYELRIAFNKRQEQFTALISMLEEKDTKITQMEQDYRQHILKLEQYYNIRLTQRVQVQIRQNEKQISKLAEFYQQKITLLTRQNTKFLNQNSILSDRLDQLMKYIKDEEQIKEQNDCISPRIICQFKRQTTPFKEYQASSDSSMNENHRLLTEQQYSPSSQSNKRVALNQILNTEDKRVFNFNQNYTSKVKQYLHGSNDQNHLSSTLIKGNQTEEKKIKIDTIDPNLIKQFKDNEGESNLHQNPYYIFFTITTQCAKINSGRLEEIGSLDMTSQWNKLMDKKIPLHEWYSYLTTKIQQKLTKVSIQSS